MMDVFDGLILSRIMENLSTRNTASLAISHRFARSVAEPALASAKETARRQRLTTKLFELRDFLDAFNESIRRDGAEVFSVSGLYVCRDHPKRTAFYDDLHRATAMRTSAKRMSANRTTSNLTGITVLLRSLAHAAFDFVVTIVLDGRVKYDMYVLKHARARVSNAFFNDFMHATKHVAGKETEMARGVAMEFPVEVLQKLVKDIHADA